MGPSEMGKDEVGMEISQPNMSQKAARQKSKWGPILAERSIRIRNDGRTSLDKAQEQKKKEDLEDIYAKGKSKKHLKDSKNFLQIATKVGVDLGVSEAEKESNLQLCVNFHNSRNANKTDEVGEGDLCQKRVQWLGVLKVLNSKEDKIMMWRTWNLEGEKIKKRD
jgi:hypothetical protein